MALAVNGSGTIFKKCDRANHRPDSNKGCASSTCQHTCGSPERCHHARTLRCSPRLMRAAGVADFTLSRTRGVAHQVSGYLLPSAAKRADRLSGVDGAGTAPGSGECRVAAS